MDGHAQTLTLEDRGFVPDWQIELSIVGDGLSNRVRNFPTSIGRGHDLVPPILATFSPGLVF